MLLTKEQKRAFVASAHHKKPVVTIGAKGLTEPVVTEIELALTHHELLKIKVQGADRETCHQIAEEIVAKSNAALIQEIGHIIVIYRETPKKKTKPKSTLYKTGDRRYSIKTPRSRRPSSKD